MKIPRLTDKICVVIGGTSGLGLAIAEAFVKEGACVIPVSRHLIKVRSTIKKLRALGNTWSLPLVADVCSEKSIKELVTKITKKSGKIDVAVTTAGVHLKKDFNQMTSKEWQRVLETNLTGTYLVNKYFGAVMVKRGSGSLINISSLGAQVALSKAAAYCVSKAGVSMLTKCLAVEWAKSGVRVNALVPGVFPTPLNERALADPVRRRRILNRTPVGRFGKTEEIAGAAVYLASDEASFVTGIEFVVDGGFLASSGF